MSINTYIFYEVQAKILNLMLRNILRMFNLQLRKILYRGKEDDESRRV